MAGLGWFDWILGLLRVTFDTITQRVKAVHLPRQLPLIPLSHMTCIITGATSGIGLETARHLAKSGAHVVLAVRNVKAAKNLLEEWQSGQEDGSSPLNVEVIPLPSSILRLVSTCLHSLQITWMILLHLKKCATKAHHTQ
jgi:hypothetical protein